VTDREQNIKIKPKLNICTFNKDHPSSSPPPIFFFLDIYVVLLHEMRSNNLTIHNNNKLYLVQRNKWFACRTFIFFTHTPLSSAVTWTRRRMYLKQEIVSRKLIIITYNFYFSNITTVSKLLWKQSYPIVHFFWKCKFFVTVLTFEIFILV
jgi:hypothetical protein